MVISFLILLKRPTSPSAEKKKYKCHFQADLPSRIVRKGTDLHCFHYAILPSDSITHQTLQGMQKDLRMSQMPTVARQHRRSAFLGILKYLNLSFLNRNLLFIRYIMMLWLT